MMAFEDVYARVGPGGRDQTSHYRASGSVFGVQYTPV